MPTEDALVSVVIPVYNVEAYLDRCITSVVNQTYQNLDIILVDDGSPDNCPQMCEEWAKRDNRIKVIHKKNAGLGWARNTGMENAHGEYICFLDSDDYLQKDIIAKAVLLAHNECVEVVYFGLSRADSKGNIIESFVPVTTKTVYAGQEIQNVLLPDFISGNSSVAKNKNLGMSVCTSLFKMELIQRVGWKLVSERDIISEDTYSILDLYRNVQSVAVLAEAGYVYCCNNSSLTRTYRKDRFEKIKQFYISALKLHADAGYSEEVQDRLTRVFMSFTVSALKQIAGSKEKFREKIRSIRTIVCDNMLQSALRAIDLRGFNIKLRAFFLLIQYKQVFAVYMLSKLQAEIRK